MGILFHTLYASTTFHVIYNKDLRLMLPGPSNQVHVNLANVDITRGNILV